MMNGLWTFLTPDTLPIVGPSVKFKNLFYNMGNLDSSIESQVRNANYIRERVSNEILEMHSHEPIKRASHVDFEHLRPARFLM